MKGAAVIAGLLAAALAAGGSVAAVRASGASTCSAHAPRIDVGTQGAMQATITMVDVRLRPGASACHLRGVLRIHLTNVRGVRGDPARLRLDATLAPGSLASRGWAWRNWCGAHRTARAVVRFDAVRTSVRESAPVCEAPGAASTLSRFG